MAYRAEDGWPVEDIAHVAVVRHPFSSRAEISLQHVRQLQILGDMKGFELTQLESTPSDDENKAMLQGLKGVDVLAVASGDGTLSRVMNSAMDVELAAPILMLPGGRVNDMATQVLGSRTNKAYPAYAIHSLPRLIRPIDVHLEGDVTGQPLPRAFAYFTLGASGITARDANSPIHRREMEYYERVGGFKSWIGQQLIEKAMAARSVIENQPFQILEENRYFRAAEFFLTNGDRMARDMRFYSDLFSDKTLRMRARSKPVAVAMLAGFLTKIPLGQQLDGKLNVEIACPPEGVYGQIDGEDFHMKGRVQLKAQQSADGVYVLSG